jgi:hypothetical protein
MNKVPIPSDIPLLVGKSADLDKVVATITSRGNPDLEILFKNLCLLTCYVRVKVWLDTPTVIHSTKRKYNDRATEAIIGKFFEGNCGWGYSSRHEKVRKGFHCSDWVPHITRYEPLIDKALRAKTEGFKSLESFARKFDFRFITLNEIKNLYTGKSSQHGGAYTPNDFRQIGPRGKEVLKRFLLNFKGLDVEGPCYTEYSGRKSYTERYASWHHAGRDISICHTLGVPVVHYSSEYCGCGNGRYGLLVNEHEFLWLEDD